MKSKVKPIEVTKNYRNAVKYIQAVNARPDSKNVPKIGYVETIEKYIGKTGKPLKRALRSQKARAEFNAAVKLFNKKRPSTRDIGRLATESAKSGGKLSFRSVAKMAASGDIKLKTFRALRDDVVDKLKEEMPYDIFGNLMNSLASVPSITTEDFYDVLDIVQKGVADLPESALQDLQLDDLHNYIDDIKRNTGTVDEELILQYINADNPDNVTKAAEYIIAQGEDLSGRELESIGEHLSELEENGIDIYILSEDDVASVLNGERI